MKTSTIKLLCFCLLHSAFCLSSHAQGTAFTYQGRLNDGAGPAGGIYDLRFTIYDSTNLPGVVVGGPLTNSAVNVSNGLFTAVLDFGGGAFNGADRWLELAVRSNSLAPFTPLAPRQPITPSPYAMRAANFSGAVTDAQLPASLARLNGSNQVFTGAVQFNNPSNSFTGNGAGVTGVDLRTASSAGAIVWATNNFGFSLASPLVVGNGPMSVTAADVNGDGKMDLISGNDLGSLLSVLTNNGSGGFVLASIINVGAYPFSVVAADVNGDGKVDLISTASALNALTVLTNDGNAGFVLASSPTVGSSPHSVVAADVNGDGKVDLISANSATNTLTVLTNNGSGGFVLASSPGVGKFPYSITAADVNGDGKVDLISASASTNTLTVLTNNGSGGFVLASSPAVGTNPLAVTAADVNGDGKADLITANQTAKTLSVLTNNGSGGFVMAASLSMGNYPDAVAAADINGDGKVDLIGANYYDNTLTVFTNNGSGGFALASSPGVGTGPLSITAADVNGDGKVDLISADYGTNTLTVLLNSVTITANFTGNGAGLTDLGLAGLNADNITSGTVADARLNANVARLNATQTFSGANTFNFPANSFTGNGAGLTSLNAANLSSGTLPDARMPALTGDVTSAAGSTATTLANTTVTPGSYTAANITVDAKGRISAAANGTVGAPSANYLFAFSSAAQAVASANVFQDVTFNNDAQISGWTHTSGTAEYTNAQSGLYLIQYTAKVATTGAVASTNVTVLATLNSSSIAGSQNSAAVSIPLVTLSKSFIANINAADVLKLQFTGTGTGITLTAGGGSGSGSTKSSMSMTIVRIQ